jgi:hypothetical protein
MAYGVTHIHLRLLSIIAVSFKVASFWVCSMCPAHLPFLEAPLEPTVNGVLDGQQLFLNFKDGLETASS